MSDNTKAEELVEITFRDGRNREVTRKVYPEVAKFITSRREGEGEWRRFTREYDRERQRIAWEKEDEYYAAGNPEGSFDAYSTMRQYDRDRREARHTAERKYYDLIQASALRPRNRNNPDNPNSWETLRQEAEAAGHKIVTWLVDHCLDQESEATVIVKYLPATSEELWTIAKEDHEMCEVFDRFMNQATAAGLFKDEELPASVREVQALRQYVSRNYGRDYIKPLMDRVRPIVKAEVAEAVVVARAEWESELLAKYQEATDMRELLRSLADSHPLIQTHLNRSDAARRAAETRRQNSMAERNELADRVGQALADAGAQVVIAPATEEHVS